jgi:HTH-type transcriptional regulator / antitoxin HigA
MTFPLMQITNQQEFDEANKIIDSLIDADLISDPIEREIALANLYEVTTLAHQYEIKHFSIPKPPFYTSRKINFQAKICT